MDDNLEHVAFDEGHSIAQLPREDRFRSMRPELGAAQVDIDNDGVVERVFGVGFDSSAGRGCTAGRLAVVDETGRNVPDSWLNRQLLRDLGFACDSVLEVAMHEGVAYVDAQNSAGDRTLYRIDSRRVTSVCEFHAVQDYDVPGDSPSPPR